MRAEAADSHSGRPVRVRLISFEFAPFTGGHGTYATEMARALAELGASVDVLAPHYSQEEAEEDARERFRISRALRHQRLDVRSLLTIHHWLGAREANEIVLCADIRSAMVLGLLAFLRPTRFVAMFHGSEVLKAQRSLLPRLIARFIGRRASALVANSAYTAGLVSSVTGRTCTPALLGVSPYWGEPAAGPFNDPLLAAIPDQAVVISTVGRLEPRKGHLDAIEAIEHLQASGDLQDFRYVVAGAPIDPDYTAKVKARLEALQGCGAYVGIIEKDDLRRLYARSTVLVLPARREPNSIEGFGLVTVEAASQGCPSVVTDVGGLAEAVRMGGFGLISRPHDIGALTASLNDLLTNEPRRRTMAQNGRRHAGQATWRQTARDTPLVLGDDADRTSASLAT